MLADHLPVRSAAAAKRSRAADLVGFIVGAALAGLFALYLVQPPAPVSASLDQSWRIGLTMAAHAGALFGRDIVFTFGPLGFVLQGSADPTLAPWSIAISLGLAAIVAGSVALAFRGRSSLAQRVALATVLVSISTLVSVDYVITAGMIALLARGSRFPRLAWVVGGAIGVATLFGLLSKYTLALDVAGAAGAVWLTDAVTGPRRRRRAALTAAALATAIVCIGIGVAFRFSFHAIAAYVQTAQEIAGGYSSAMAIAGPRSDLVLAFAVGSTAIVLAVVAWRERKPVLLPLTVVTLFLAFKHGFVRQDGHVIYFFATGAATTAIIAITLRETRGRIVGLAATVVTFALLLISYQGLTHAFPPLFSGDRLSADLAYILEPVATQRRLAADEPSQLADDRLAPALRDRIGASTTDVLPTETALIAANGLQWDPLPVFQSYSAYTPTLDRLNRDALRGHGAQTILYAYTAIDYRYPLAEAPSTMTELACRYRPLDASPETIGSQRYVILDRKQNAECRQRSAGAADAPALGVPIAVPQPRGPSEFIVASFDVRPFAATRLRTLLFRSPTITLEFTFDDGSTHVYRVVPETMSDGVIIDPVPRDSDEAAALFAGRRLPAVRSVTVRTRPGSYSLDAVRFTRMWRSGA